MLPALACNLLQALLLASKAEHCLDLNLKLKDVKYLLNIEEE